MASRSLPPVEELHRLFEYREDGVLLWRVSPSNASRGVGKPAGTLHPEGYCSIAIWGVQYLRHRIVWAMHKGEWPTSRLDHEDTNKGNDMIGNLRYATHSQNLANTKVRRNSKTGVKGVSIKKGSGKYVAQINANGKVKCLGYFTDIDEASEAYRKAAIEAFGEFARF